MSVLEPLVDKSTRFDATILQNFDQSQRYRRINLLIQLKYQIVHGSSVFKRDSILFHPRLKQWSFTHLFRPHYFQIRP